MNGINVVNIFIEYNIYNSSDPLQRIVALNNFSL